MMYLIQNATRFADDAFSKDHLEDISAIVINTHSMYLAIYTAKTQKTKLKTTNNSLSHFHHQKMYLSQKLHLPQILIFQFPHFI